jgi:type VI protein secretion system component VasK
VDALRDTLYSAYVWAKEWQVLLAGLLIFFAALILARAILRAAKINAATGQRSDVRERGVADLRQAARSGLPATSSELIGTLEQLRSMVRSALASLSQASEKENGPAYFLCQRIAHLRPERLALPPNATRAALDMRTELSEQLETLRQYLKKDAPPGEIFQILVQLNASARNLAGTLVPVPVKGQQSGSNPR